MGYVPVRDEQGRIVDMVRRGPFQSDDEPAELRPASPPPVALPTPATEPPRRRSRLGDELNGQNQRVQLGSLAAIAIVGALIYLAWPALQNQAVAPSAPALETPISASAVATRTITATPTSLALLRAVVAYDAPGGAPLGALEPGRTYVLAEDRAAWRRLHLAGGDVWVRGWEMDGLPPPSPTLSPTPTAIPAPVVLPPAAPASPWPPPAPQATCKTVILDGEEIGQACGTSAEQLHATASALMRTPHGGVPVEIVTVTPLKMTPPPARP